MASPSHSRGRSRPGVERAILRCLEPDPRARPTSALAVAAALYGGDPLAAALAAGETPSPEMVAAAGEEGTLRPALGIPCLAGFLLGLVLLVAVQDRVVLFRQGPFDLPPEVLADRAAQVMKIAGYPEKPADTARGFKEHQSYLRYVQEKDPSPDRWESLLRRGTLPASSSGTGRAPGDGPGGLERADRDPGSPSRPLRDEHAAA